MLLWLNVTVRASAAVVDQFIHFVSGNPSDLFDRILQARVLSTKLQQQVISTLQRTRQRTRHRCVRTRAQSADRAGCHLSQFLVHNRLLVSTSNALDVGAFARISQSTERTKHLLLLALLLAGTLWWLWWSYSVGRMDVEMWREKCAGWSLKRSLILMVDELMIENARQNYYVR
jgi:hypothetical protein